MSWLPDWCKCWCSCPVNCSTPTMAEELQKKNNQYRLRRPSPIKAPLETARGPRIIDHAEFAAAIGNNPQTHPQAAKSKRHRKLESTDIMDVSAMLKWDDASYNKYMADRAKLSNEQRQKS